MDLEQKLFSIKALTEEGQIEAVISTFGQVDRDGDIMLAEAFSGSDGKSIPMVWSHNWDQPIGKGVVEVKQSEAVLRGKFFLDTAAGQDAYKTVKAMGDLQQYSIGFRITDADFGYQENDAGQRIYVRTIKGIELFEASPVLVGAAYGTRTLAVKSAQHQDIHDQLKALQEQHESACELGDECPFTLADIANAEIVDVEDEEALTEKQKQIKELEAVLGYRPLIAEKVF